VNDELGIISEGSGRSLFYIPEFTWKDREDPRTTSVSVDGIPTKNRNLHLTYLLTYGAVPFFEKPPIVQPLRNMHLPNTYLNIYRYDNLLAFRLSLNKLCLTNLVF
jgi:hypothetical protein